MDPILLNFISVNSGPRLNHGLNTSETISPSIVNINKVPPSTKLFKIVSINWLTIVSDFQKKDKDNIDEITSAFSINC